MITTKLCCYEWQNNNLFFPGRFQIAFLLLLLKRSDEELSYEMTGKHLQRSTEIRDTPWRKAFMLHANLWAPHPPPTAHRSSSFLPRNTTNPGCPWPQHFPNSAGLSSLAWNSGINLTVFPSRGLILQFSWRQFSCLFQQKWYLKMNGRIIPIWNISGQQHQIKWMVKRDWMENDDRAKISHPTNIFNVFISKHLLSKEEDLSLFNVI